MSLLIEKFSNIRNTDDSLVKKNKSKFYPEKDNNCELNKFFENIGKLTATTTTKQYKQPSHKQKQDLKIYRKTKKESDKRSAVVILNKSYNRSKIQETSRDETN